jgi:uncharacterized protein YvpB
MTGTAIPDVPFISQMEGGSGFNNCGPAALAMCLARMGAVSADQAGMHRVADVMRDGAEDGRGIHAGTYTTFQQMDAAAAHFGHAGHLIYSWDEVFATMDRGQPVILLVDNTVLEPRQYPRYDGWQAHHFIVLGGYDADNFQVNDPLDWFGEHWTCLYSGQSVRAGAAAVGGVYGFALAGPPPAPDPAVEWSEPITGDGTGEALPEPERFDGDPELLAVQAQLAASTVALEKADRIKAEFERYIREPAYKRQVNRAARVRGVTPADLLIEWGSTED